MKPVLSLLLAMLILGPLRAQKDIVVYGDLKGVEDGTKVILFQTDGNVGTGVATDTIRKGHFILKCKRSEQVGEFTLGCSGRDGFPPMSLQLFAKSGSVIRVTGKNKLLKTWMVQSDVPEQKEYDRFVAANRTAWNQVQRLWVHRAFLRKDMDKKSKEERETVDRSCDSLNTLSGNIERQIQQQEIKMLQHSAVSDVTMIYLSNAARFVKYEEDSVFRQPVAALYAALSQQRQQSRLGEEIYALLYPPMVVKTGEAMVDADLSDKQGNIHHLADYHGKYLLLDFWSMGCGPCHMAVPELKELSLTYKQQLEVIGVSLDTKKLWAGIDNKEMIWTDLNDGNENRGIAARYGVGSIPQYVLISPDGILLDSWVGYDKGNLIAKIKEYVKD